MQSILLKKLQSTLDAGRCLDQPLGNTKGTPVFFANNHGTTNNVYWQVDLGANTPLAYANLFSRSITNTTSQFDVEVFDSSMNLVDSVIVNNSDPSGPTPDFDHAMDLTGFTGRYVRVATTSDSYLALSELQVFAVPEPSAIVLAGLGLVGLVVANRRRVVSR